MTTRVKPWSPGWNHEIWKHAAQLALLVVCAALLGGCPLGRASADGKVPETEIWTMRQNVEVFEHASGMRVLLQQNSAAPVVTFQVWVGVGASDERPGEEGLAHLHEHMIFKGTPTMGPGEFAGRVEALGGSVNAWTSHDRTMYYATVPRSARREGCSLLLDAVLRSRFDAEELRREIDVVLEEIRRGDDMPGRGIRQRVFELAFGDHPYGRAVIGTAESVRSFDRAAVVAFFERWYRPSNMTLVVAGDIDRADLIATLDEVAGTTRSAAVTRGPAEEVDSLAGVHVAIEERDVQQALMIVAFRAPAFGAGDAAALEVLATLLGQGESARLYDRLQRGAGLVEGVSSSVFAARRGGLFVLGASYRPDAERTPEQLLNALVHEIVKLQEAPISQREIERAVRQVESDAIWQRQTVQGVASRLGQFDAMGGDIEAESRYLREVASVDAVKLRDVARRWLRPDAAVVGLLLPTSSERLAPESAAIAQTFAESWTAALAMQREREIVTDEHGIVFHRYANGLRLIVQRDSTSPTFAVRAIVAGGSVAEDSATAGAHALLGSLLTSGTAIRTAQAQAEVIEGLAASLQGFSGRNHIGLAMSALSRDLDVSLDIFADALFASTLPEDELARVRSETLARIAAQRDQLAGSAWEMFEQVVYAGHAYARPALGTRESVAQLERDELMSLYRATVRPERMVVSVVGDVDPATVVDLVGGLFDVPIVGESAAVPAPGMANRPEAPVRVESARDRQQAHIVLGFPAPSVNDPDADVMRVLATILSGQGGRLFVELRDVRSLAYSVSASYSPGIGAGSFSLYIATSGARQEEAVEALRAEVERLRREGVTASDVERAQSMLIGRRESGLQTAGARAGIYAVDELHGTGYTEGFSYTTRIGAVDADSVARAVEAWLRAEWEIVSVIRSEPGNVPATDAPNGPAAR